MKHLLAPLALAWSLRRISMEVRPLGERHLRITLTRRSCWAARSRRRRLRAVMTWMRGVTDDSPVTKEEVLGDMTAEAAALAVADPDDLANDEYAWHARRQAKRLRRFLGGQVADYLASQYWDRYSPSYAR